MSAAAPGPRRPPAWSETAIARLLDVTGCPVCEVGVVAGRHCPHCGADFAGAIGRDLWVASRTAVEALRTRQAILDLVPQHAEARAAGNPADAGTGPAGAPTPATLARAAEALPTGPVGPGDAPRAAASVAPAAPFPAPAEMPYGPVGGASATVQSVLAVAGAGLFAIAAVVFTFFNPDLTDPLPRALIVGAISAAFLGGAVLLSRRRLRFSSEAVGALGAVFVALAVAAVLPLLPRDVDGWVFGGLATLVCGSGLALLGPRAGIRAWRWCGLVALAFVPLMLALGAGSALAVTAGCLASAAAASALVAVVGRTTRHAAESVTLTVVQIVMVLAALLTVWGVDDPGGVPTAIVASVAFAATAGLALSSARHPAGLLWTGAGGAAMVAAVAVLPLAAPAELPFGAWFGVFPVAAGVGLIAVGALTPLHRIVPRAPLFAGAVVVVAIVAAGPTPLAFLAIAETLARPSTGAYLLLSDTGAGLTVGLAALALSLGAFATLTARRASALARDDRAGASARGSSLAAAVEVGDDEAAPDVLSLARPVGTRWLGFAGAWYAVLAFLTVLCLPTVELWARIGLALVAAIGASAIVAMTMRDAPAARRLPLIVGAHAAVLFAAVLSWRDDDLTVWGGIAVVVAIGALAVTVPRAARFVHVGVGFAYALVVLATALARAGADALVVVCLTTCAAGAVAIGVTFARRVPPREWYAVLAVTAVPFAIGVLQVVVERSGWTALSTAVIFCLALTLVTTTRDGLSPVVRTLAAATLVPAVAVVVVCLGAQLLATSGSPVVLPLIAAIVAGVLASSDAIMAALARRLPPAPVVAAGRAIEASALLTAAIAVGLSLARTAAGLPTTLLVLVILGVGFAAAALFSPRRYAWPLAGAAFTGALWSAWGIAGVTGLEPYLLPPALGAAVVAAVLTALGRRTVGLYTVGLGVAVVPVLVALALEGATGEWRGLGAVTASPGGASGVPVRAYALVAAAWLLVAATVAVTRATARPVRRLRALRTPTLAVAIAAAAAAAVEGVRWGLGLDPAPTDPSIVAALGFGLVGAGAAASAAVLMRRQATDGSALGRTRWLGVPAVLILGLAAWFSIERDWFVIWTMWALLLAFLAFMLATAARALRGPTGLPPVWFLFAVSFVTAVVAWSPRDLRVEWFSLPLGLFLLAAGALALRARDAVAPAPTRSLETWPAGWSGSWALLGPGLVTMLSASIAATYTDPRTWRAILVMVIALAAILVGARQRLAAPFLLGIIVLPVENLLAFMVQIGRGIQAMPWWITLSVVGAVLLIIAVGYERRADEGTGIAARLRDLG